MQAISSHRGICNVKCLIFGVGTGAANWQRFIEQLLQNTDGAVCFLTTLGY